MTEQPTPETTVRVRQSEDLEASTEALIKVHSTDGYPVEGVDDPQAWLMPTGLLRAWVGELGGKVVGHVLITTPQDGDAAAKAWADEGNPVERIAVLGRLFVLPAARRHSLGKQLVRATSAYADEQGLRLVLDVMEKDTAAIRLYERLGWRRIGTTSHDAGRGEDVPAYCYVSPPWSATPGSLS